jgi:hypothetical protein
MEHGRSLYEAIVNHTIETNKQAYDFANQMFKAHLEFSRNLTKLVPGLDAWSQLVPVASKK